MGLGSRWPSFKHEITSFRINFTHLTILIKLFVKAILTDFQKVPILCLRVRPIKYCQSFAFGYFNSVKIVFKIMI